MFNSNPEQVALNKTLLSCCVYLVVGTKITSSSQFHSGSFWYFVTVKVNSLRKNTRRKLK